MEKIIMLKDLQKIIKMLKERSMDQIEAKKWTS